MSQALRPDESEPHAGGGVEAENGRRGAPVLGFIEAAEEVTNELHYGSA